MALVRVDERGAGRSGEAMTQVPILNGIRSDDRATFRSHLLLRQKKGNNVSMEVWKEVPGYAAYYEVSSEGKIRSLDRTVCHLKSGRFLKGKQLKPRINKQTGYPAVNLTIGNKRKTFTVHSIVALAFLGPLPPGKQVAHCDGDRLNSSISNLRHASVSENCADAKAHGTVARGSKLPFSKLNEDMVREIRASSEVQRRLAKRLGVSEATISRVKNGVDWSWVA